LVTRFSGRCSGRISRCAQLLLLLVGLTVSTATVSAQSASDSQGDTWGDNSKPENHVQSKGPAEEGETYKWIQMGYAGIVMFCMVGFMFWLIRRTPAKTHKIISTDED
jgi:hypothetical protein